MPDVFLSFATQRNVWKNIFVEVSQLGQKLRILDYKLRPLVAGKLDQAIAVRLDGCEGFIALVDEHYTKSDACRAEFEFAAGRFGLNSARFGAFVLDDPGRQFVRAAFDAAGHPKQIYIDLVNAAGDGPRQLDEDGNDQIVLNFAAELVKALAQPLPPPGPGPTPRVIALGLPKGDSSKELASLRQELVDALKRGGIATALWNDNWTTSGPPDSVKKALQADRPPMFVLPLDNSMAIYYSKTTLQGFVRKALGDLVAGDQRQLPKCVVWCPKDPPQEFSGNAGVTADTDDCLRNDPQDKLIDWLRAELGIATWKTAVISVEGYKGKPGDKSAANQIGRHLKDILFPAVRDICRPPEPVVTNFYSVDSPKSNLEAEFARQLKQYVGSGVAILTIHDLSLGMAPDWPTAYNDLKQKISRYQKLINKITDQNLVDRSRIVKLAIVMSNREFKLGSEVYADDDLVDWKIIGMSLRDDGTMEIEAGDTAMFTEAVCSVVNRL